MSLSSSNFDVCIIGGGVNGAGIARDLAGRGVRVLLLEKGDLASATSSSSTKLIHGGLRYLEHYEFGLVRESLKERNVLLNAAPHIIWPMRFILPYEKHLRPRWLLKAGLFLYDNLAKRHKQLKGSKSISLTQNIHDNVLNKSVKQGFEYSDCWVEDSRLVVLNAVDAVSKGADVRTYSECVNAKRKGGMWIIHVQDKQTGQEYCVSARCIVNAAGPWAESFLQKQSLTDDHKTRIRLVKGSHIITNKIYDGEHAYILQQPDKRIIFTIPYEGKYTLVGTTEEAYVGNPNEAKISHAEIDYLCAGVNRIFTKKISQDSIISTYSGVRPLIEDGTKGDREVSRGYHIKVENEAEAPLINIFGGKITTFRVLSEKLSSKLCSILGIKATKWTHKAKLPGGDFGDLDFESFVAVLAELYPFLSDDTVFRLARAYGTKAYDILGNAKSSKDLGKDFSYGVYEAELIYLMEKEMAKTSEDILWRRSKLGLHMSQDAQKRIASFVESYHKRKSLM